MSTPDRQLGERRPVAFLSDYGLVDEFVGVCKGVMLGIAPDLTILDITHDLPPHDVRAGALALVRAVQYLPERSVVLAVVDPGVGTDRRMIAVECAGGTMVGPDNGLLAPAVAMLGGASDVFALDREEYRLPAPGPTFAGRDVMAPATAYLASGTAPGDLGSSVDPSTLVPALLALPNVTDDGALECEVWWVDRFGNAQLNVGPEELVQLGGTAGGLVEVVAGDRAKSARWVHTYADAKPGELVVMVDSYGLCALVLDRASAAEEFTLRAGSSVTLTLPGTDRKSTRLNSSHQ